MINKHATHISDQIKPNKDAISFLFLSPENTLILVIIIVYNRSSCNTWLWITFLLGLQNVFRRLICATQLCNSSFRNTSGIRNYIFFAPYISYYWIFVVYSIYSIQISRQYRIYFHIMLNLILEKRAQYLDLALFKWSL